jgi:hypothetical protein
MTVVLLVTKFYRTFKNYLFLVRPWQFLLQLNPSMPSRSVLLRHRPNGSQVLSVSNTQTSVKFSWLRYIIFKHNQQDATLHNGIIYYKCSKCFRRFLRPSSGAQNCIHSIGYLSSFSCLLPLSWVSWNNSLTIAEAEKLDKYPMLCIQFWAPDDGRRNRLKHVEHL